MPTEPASALPDLLAAATAGGAVTAVLAMVIGLILLSFGRALLRPGFVATGALAGGCAGTVFALGFDAPVPAWTVGIAAAVVCAIVAWLAYRPVLGLALAILLGIACPTGVIAWAQARGLDVVNANGASEESTSDGNEAAGDRPWNSILADLEQTLELMRDADDAMAGLRGFVHRSRERPAPGSEVASSLVDDEHSGDDTLPATEADSSAWVEKLVETYEAARADFLGRWDAAPVGVRRSILLSAACGFVLGMLIGISIPSIAASVVTALAGSGFLLAGTAAASYQFGFAGQGFMPQTPVHWLTVWVIVAVLGIAIQWTVRRKRADTAESD